MKLRAGLVLLIALGVPAVVGDAVRAQAQAQAPVSALDRARAAIAAGQPDDAWRWLDQAPVTEDTLRVGVDLALAPRAPRVEDRRLPWIADRAARLGLASRVAEVRAAACAVVVRFSGDRDCATEILEAAKPFARPAAERARAWRVQQWLGAQPPALSADWEREVRGAVALEMGAWTELPPASRVRLLEPLLASQDMGDQIAALVTLQTVPGPDALAVFTRLAATPPSFPGARTLITVGLARHGNAEARAALAPVETQLSAGDRMALAVGRMERGDPAGRAALITFVTSGAEPDAVRAAELLATAGPEPRIEQRVQAFVREASPAVRVRWIELAGRLGLGNTPDVIRHTLSDDDATRVAAGLAVAVRAVRPQAPPR